MDKDLLDAIGVAITKALESSEGRIRRLENKLAAMTLQLLEIDKACDALEAESKNLPPAASAQDLAEITGRVAMVESGLVKLAVEDLPAVRNKAQASLAESALVLDARIDEVAKSVSDVTESLSLAEQEISAVMKAQDAYGDDVEAQFKSVYDLVTGVQKRVDVDTKAHPIYVEDEVVRAGAIRRFGFGGVFEALTDTAKSVHTAPEDWRMISDGLYLVESDVGLCMRTFTGAEYALRHGETGQEGQRGKQGVPGLRGNDGVGITDVVVSEKGMYLELSNGKSEIFDFTLALEKAKDGLAENVIVEIAPVIKSFIAEYGNAQLQ